MVDDTLECCRVLVVDDDTNIRLLTRAILEEAGHTIYECQDGNSVREEFLRVKPDILLLDVLLPGKDGFAVCEEIRGIPQGQNISIIMMTGLDDIDSIHKAFRVGATDFITKPINWQILAYRVHYIFRSSKAFRALRVSEARLHQAQELARMGNWEWEPLSGRLQFSESCRHVLGLTSDSTVYDITSFFSSVLPCDLYQVRSGLDLLKEPGKIWSIDCQMTAATGKIRSVHLEAESRWDDDSQSVLITGTVQDISDRKRDEEKIRNLAYYDSLTGLPNRVLFKEHLKRALSVASSHKKMLAILFLDLDRFKGINDSLGHDVGDLLLQQVARRLQQRIRPYDILSRLAQEQKEPLVARLGGDEFTIMLEGIQSPDCAALVARRVIDTLDAPFNLNGNEAYISCSIGISIFPNDGTEVDTLVKNADVAMYCSKDIGRSTFQFYTQEMNSASLNRLVLETQFRKSFEKGEFSIHYQPQVDCVTNRIVGLEALVRWNSPELGWISPVDFIPIAEDTGLIIALDRWVISTVCQQLEEWRMEQLLPVRIAFNLSAKHFLKNHLKQTVDLVLQHNETSLSKLEIEITEGTLIEHTEDVIDALNLLKDTGVRISIDDFGTGYSSLSYLTSFPFHALKIDKSFVSRITENSESALIVNAIVALARSLHKEVVAEGIETPEQLAFLKNIGCTVIQGYLFSRPLPEQEIRQLLRADFIHGLSPQPLPYAPGDIS